MFFEISEIPFLYSFGYDVFLNEMVTLAGGTNIFENKLGWITVGEESVIELDPEITTLVFLLSIVLSGLCSGESAPTWLQPIQQVVRDNGFHSNSLTPYI